MKTNYFELAALSASEIKCFLASPNVWFHRYVAKDWPPMEATPDMVLGSEVHRMIELGGPDKLGIITIPSDVLNADGHRKGKPWLTWSKEQPEGSVLVKETDLVPHYEIWKALLLNKFTFDILNGTCEHEVELSCTDPLLGFTKAKVDTISNNEWIVDWKTTSTSRDRHAYTISDRHYDIQLVFYRRIVELVRGVKCRACVCMIETSGGFEVTPYELDSAWMDDAEARMFLAARDMNRFVWRDYMAGTGVKQLRQPARSVLNMNTIEA
jgi:hypothetical protein